MKTFQLSLILFFIIHSLTAQNDNSCFEDFKWLTNYIEKNLPAFQNDITDLNRNTYQKFKSDIKEEVSQANTIKKCFKPLVRYTKYFFDNHTRIVNITTQDVNEGSEESIRKFKNSSAFLSVERIAIDADVIRERYINNSIDDIEGIYKSDGGAYEVVIMNDEKGTRDYIGVILKSSSKLWEPGMVKFELTKTGANTFEAFYYYRNHSIILKQKEVFNKGKLSEGWSKINNNHTSKKELNKTPNTLFHFEKLNANTNYLYLRSFDGALKPRYDSLYVAIKERIKALPHLIIDVRHNGGGSDTNIEFLRSIMYTNPYEGGRQQIWNSEGVRQQYELFLAKAEADQKTYGKSTVKWAKSMLRRIKNGKKNTFIYSSKWKKKMRFKATDFPQKIVLIQSHYTGSTAENVVISGMNSDKTTTIGENTGGYLGYGNIFDINSPSGNFKLWASTTQNDYKMQFEANGIPPQIQLSKDVDWVEEALKILDKN